MKKTQSKKEKKPKYRSDIEASVGSQITSQGLDVFYETMRLPYTIPASKHHYTPDFELVKKGQQKMILEVKGTGARYGLTLATRKKMLYIKETYPELDIRFVFINAKFPLRRGSKTTYAMWAEKNGFKWCQKEIPADWFTEVSLVRNIK